ncbi:MAG: imidazole glycerol phosphate synthase subunit HisH [Methylophaga sp.]|nr:imidazole glycerol phosphate synthase subunit HisH [Methylophaga sp.]
MHRVAVIDYGMGNLRSVSKALEAVASEHEIIVTADAKAISNASHIVFPGVGAIRDCMSTLQQTGLDDIVRTAAASKPFLGICLGMQALMSHSEENSGTEGLGIIPGNVRYFDQAAAQGLKVPHMGWNQVSQRLHPLWHNISDDSRFYFVHSYYVDPQTEQSIAGVSDYSLKFASAVTRDNVFAVQFHPEKSQHAGLQLLKNFLDWDGLS